MKKLIFLIALIILNQSVVNANGTVDDAINSLKSINESQTLEVLNGKNYTKNIIPVNIVEEYDLPYEYHQALAITNVEGENKLSIYINGKIKSSPPEAVACLIAHESIHIQPGADSMDQEVQAWTYELSVWKKFVNKNPNLLNNNDILTRRLNKMMNANSTELRLLITSREIYSDLK